MHLYLHFMQVVNSPTMFLLTLQFSDLLWFGSPRNRQGPARQPRSPPPCSLLHLPWSPCSSHCCPPPTAASAVASACSGPNPPQPQGPTCPHHSPQPWKITLNYWGMGNSCYGPVWRLAQLGVERMHRVQILNCRYNLCFSYLSQSLEIVSKLISNRTETCSPVSIWWKLLHTFKFLYLLLLLMEIISK